MKGKIRFAWMLTLIFGLLLFSGGALLTEAEAEQVTPEDLLRYMEWEMACGQEAFTPENWSVLQEAFHKTQEILAKEDPVQSEIEEEVKEVIALLGMSGPCDQTDLAETIRLAESLTANLYTSESWSPLLVSLSTAKSVSRIGCVGQPSIDRVQRELLAALSGLEFSTRIRGDVDADGVIDSTDARLVLQHTVERIVLPGNDCIAADISRDGIVNSQDARQILNASVE